MLTQGLVLLSALLPLEAHAKGDALSSAATAGGAAAKTVKLDKITIYTPKTGGINGSCGGGALGGGIQICQQLLEPYVKTQQNKFVAGAVPCKGSNTANAFGGAYESEDMKKATNSPAEKFIVGAVDHYKCGGGGQGGMAGSDNLDRMDIAAESESSKESQALQNLKGATLNWISSFDEFRNGNQPGGRQIARDPGAVARNDRPEESLLAENDEFVENLQEAIYAAEVAKLQGRNQSFEQRLAAYDRDFPWMILKRKERYLS